MIVPEEAEHDIFISNCVLDSNIVIVSTVTNRINKIVCYEIETTNDFYTILKLKYGDDVWAR